MDDAYKAGRRSRHTRFGCMRQRAGQKSPSSEAACPVPLSDGRPARRAGRPTCLHSRACTPGRSPPCARSTPPPRCPSAPAPPLPAARCPRPPLRLRCAPAPLRLKKTPKNTEMRIYSTCHFLSSMLSTHTMCSAPGAYPSRILLTVWHSVGRPAASDIAMNNCKGEGPALCCACMAISAGEGGSMPGGPDSGSWPGAMPGCAGAWLPAQQHQNGDCSLGA
jgi:hypothetical protein